MRFPCIYAYLSERNPTAAEGFLNALEQAAAVLSETPEIGSPRYFAHKELEGLRFYVLKGFENYLLFYRVMDTEGIVEIVRIVHGARDFPALFGKGEKPDQK
jgi:plasmid stabilization system protein ParE